MSKIKQLKVPVNPEYDFDQEPTDQAEYVNPVTLAYKQIYYANYAADVTARMNEVNKSMAEAKVALSRAKYALEDYETGLLSRYPAPTGDRKSNKLLEAYVARMAHEDNSGDERKRLIGAVRVGEEELERLHAQLENARQAHNLLRLLGEQGRTYLAFHKFEFESTK